MAGCLRTLLQLPLLTVAASAALEWKTTALDASVAPFQAMLDVSFEFKNAGSSPVTIRDLQSNCDCLTVTTSKHTYQPGEIGAILARFAVGDRYGLYERSISVVTDVSQTPTRLLVRIEVPEVATASPRSLHWDIRGASAEQHAEIRAAPGGSINFTEVIPTNDSFAARIETVEPGRAYRLSVRPAKTDAPANAALRVLGKDPAGHSVVVSVYAGVD